MSVPSDFERLVLNVWADHDRHVPDGEMKINAIFIHLGKSHLAGPTSIMEALRSLEARGFVRDLYGDGSVFAITSTGCLV